MSEGLTAAVRDVLTKATQPLSCKEIYERCDIADDLPGVATVLCIAVKRLHVLRIGKGRGCKYEINRKSEWGEREKAWSHAKAPGPAHAPITEAELLLATEHVGKPATARRETLLCDRFAFTSDQTLLLWAGGQQLEFDAPTTAKLITMACAMRVPQGEAA